MEILGYILAIFVGLSSGLMGAGGSILALPILVYFFGVEAAETAPAYSLFVVGITSFLGTYLKHKQNHVDYKMVFFFGAPTVISIFLTRYFVVPILPNEFFTFENFVFTKRILVLGLFSCLMIMAAYFMIRKQNADKAPFKLNHVFNFGGGLFIGFLSGLAGASGGFIIVPTLIKIGNLSIKIAIGTTLAIIALNSTVGFLASAKHIDIDWKLLLIFSSLSVIGMITGNYLSKKVHSENLKRSFGWFILLIGIIILIKELLFNK